VNLVPSVTEYSVKHEGDNVSDHAPVFLSFHVDALSPRREVPSVPFPRAPKPVWRDARQDDLLMYQHILREKLSNIEVPRIIECVSVEDAHGTIDRYFNGIMHACIEAAAVSVPCSSGGRRNVAGWSEHVQHWKERSIFWTRVWNESGRPQQGVLYDVVKKAKRDYKREARRVIRNQKQLTAQRMAESILTDSSRYFWDEVNRKKRKGRPPPPNSMDDVEGTDDICNLFQCKYQELYNSVSYDVNDMENLLSDVCIDIDCKCRVGQCSCSHEENFMNPRLVRDAVKNLKCNKNDGVLPIVTDHFKNACFDLYVHMSILFTLMLEHSYAPSDMLISSLIPIPKSNRKSLCDSNNYRSIALSSLACKVLDNIILKRNINVLQTSPLQFGFKKQHSTTSCTFLMKEIVNHYVNNGSPVYITMLDATKAFDRVHFVKLFCMLRKRNICPRLLKLLIQMYTSQTMSVKWNGISSHKFKCCNGVKQGAVLSPTLFCVYLDELLLSLSKSDVGCYLGHHFTGALAYADDLTLLAPSLNALQKMLNVCEQFSAKFDVKFNSSKSSLLLCNTQSNDFNIKLGNESIPVVKQTKYLGTYIGQKSNDENINQACKDLLSRCNIIISQFGFCSPSIRKSLFISFCTSFYGSPLWSLGHSKFQQLEQCWRKCIRFVLKLHPRTHSVYIPLIMGCLPLREQLMIRFVKFFKNLLTCPNPVISHAVSCCLNNHSEIANNLKSCMYFVRKPNCVIFCPDYTLSNFKQEIVVKYESQISINDVVTSNVISELQNFFIFDPLEQSQFLNSVSTL